MRAASTDRPSPTVAEPPPMAFVVSDRTRSPVAENEAMLSDAEQPVHGAVVWVDVRAGIGHIHFAQQDHAIQVGTSMPVFRRMLNGDLRPVGRLEIVKTTPGGANVRAAGGTDLSQYRRGDMVMATRKAPAPAPPAQAAAPQRQQQELTLVEWLRQ
jgi:hypothetical protein